MSETYFDLAARIAEDFADIDNDIVTDLKDNNEEYALLCSRTAEMSQEYPFISRMLYGEGTVHLTADEHEKLVQYIRLIMQRDNMERQQLYFRGHTDAFSYLKKIKVL